MRFLSGLLQVLPDLGRRATDFGGKNVPFSTTSASPITLSNTPISPRVTSTRLPDQHRDTQPENPHFETFVQFQVRFHYRYRRIHSPVFVRSQNKKKRLIEIHGFFFFDVAFAPSPDPRTPP